MARAWNANVGEIAGWPDTKLVEPLVKSTVEIAWSDFPEKLRRDVDNFLDGLTKVRRNRKNQRVRPLKPVTLRTRRAELQGAARMAVKAGVSIENLNSLAALLAPEVAEQVLEAYCKKNGEKPKLYTIDLAGRFLSIARETKCLNEADCERLNEMREVLDEDRPEGFTDKNATLIRQVLAPDVWDRVVTGLRSGANPWAAKRCQGQSLLQWPDHQACPQVHGFTDNLTPVPPRRWRHHSPGATWKLRIGASNPGASQLEHDNPPLHLAQEHPSPPNLPEDSSQAPQD
jgi:hypothetical protein